jgi:phosphoglycolate phosphatase
MAPIDRRNDPRFRAVLFDFDGTLVDSYPAITASVNHVRAHHRLPPLAEPEVRRHVGRGPAYLLEHTVPGSDPAGDLALYRSHHPTVMRTGTHLMPGVAEMMTALKEGCRAIAICSNNPAVFTRALLGHFRLTALVDAVFGPEDVARPKPAPDMVLAALARLQVPPGRALYVGDMTVDIETARSAGVKVWVVPTGSDARATLAEAGPDRILNDLREIPEELRREEGPP